MSKNECRMITYILLLYIVFWITNYFRLQTIAFMRSWANTERKKIPNRKGFHGLYQLMSNKRNLCKHWIVTLIRTSKTWTLNSEHKSQISIQQLRMSNSRIIYAYSPCTCNLLKCSNSINHQHLVPLFFPLKFLFYLLNVISYFQ